MKINDYFCSALVQILIHIWEDVKRESGGSPEQSRCCKFHCDVVHVFMTEPLILDVT